jgi:hypothetical protein
MTGGPFRIDARWPNPPPVDKRDVAHIGISAHGESLTRLIDLEAKEERDYFRSSAVSMALWLADNWWRLRYESLHDGRFPDANWRLHHELTSAPGGSLWPPLMFNSTGERVLIAPIFGRPALEGSVRFLPPTVRSVSGTEFESGIDDFFGAVLGTCAKAKDGPALQAVIGELRAERKDPEMAGWRKLEARLGYDPDRVPEQLIQDFDELEKIVGVDGVNEAAIAAPGARSASILTDALAAVKTSELVVELDVVKSISRSRITSAAVPPWQLGEEAAYQLREQQAIPDGPLLSKAFSALMAVTPKTISATPAVAKNLGYATRLRDKGGKDRIALQSIYVRDRRFELACILGDAIWETSNFGLISKAKTDRQKFQRAFAQNLLVPYEQLKATLKTDEPTNDDIDRAATTFHVNPGVIRRLLILKKVIRQETLEEQLEAA